MAAKIVVVGSFNMDFITRVTNFPHPGETVIADHYMRTPGGKGSNQAIAAARLGAEVTLVACIGEDALGDEALRVWRQEGINTQFVYRDSQSQTGVAQIMVDGNGDNLIVIAPSANLGLKASHVDAASEAISASNVLLTQLEINPQVATHALQIAKRAKTTTILNPAPATKASLDILAFADILTPNQTELEMLYGDVDILSEEAAQYMLSSDQQTVIVTLGSHGARWIKRSGTGAVDTFPVDVVDTTAAGDAFNAGLAVAIAEGRTLDEAIVFANATAALSVTKPGAAFSMPTRSEVENLLKQV